MKLDVDNTKAFDPENISITKSISGDYKITVKNYSNTANIKAKVHVFIDEKLTSTYTHTFRGGINIWNVENVRINQ